MEIIIWVIISIIIIMFIYCYCLMIYMCCEFLFPNSYLNKIKSTLTFIYNVIFGSFSTPTIQKSITIIHNKLLNDNRIIDIIIV